MPLINVKLIEDVFTPAQKGQIVERLTETMVTNRISRAASGHPTTAASGGHE